MIALDKLFIDVCCGQRLLLQTRSAHCCTDSKPKPGFGPSTRVLARPPRGASEFCQELQPTLPGRAVRPKLVLLARFYILCWSYSPIHFRAVPLKQWRSRLMSTAPAAARGFAHEPIKMSYTAVASLSSKPARCPLCNKLRPKPRF